MLSYEIGHSIGRDEEDFNKIYLDRPVRYKTFDLDYKKNFKAYLIAENIKFFMSKIDDISILNSDMAIHLVCEHIGEILAKCINPEFNTPKQILSFQPAWDSVEESKKALKLYSKESGLAGWLARLELAKMKEKLDPADETIEGLLKAISMDITPFNGESDEAKEKRHHLLRLLAFLAVIDEKAEFMDIIPESMYDMVKDFLKVGIALLANGYDTDLPEDLLNHIKYKKPKTTNPEKEAFKIDTIEGIRIARNMIIINGFEFKTLKDKNFLRDMLGFGDKSILLGVCFQDCCFSSDSNSLTEIHGHAQFQNCRFDRNIHCGYYLDGELEFDSCTFFGNLQFVSPQCENTARVYIRNCFFEKGASCDISQIHGIDDHMKIIKILNSQFNGGLKISDTQKEIYMEMKNVSFGSPFEIHDINLKNNSEFENICFSSVPSIQMDKARKDLYETLKNAGLEQRAKDLGIPPSEKETTNVKFDYDAYQVAYNSGFLKPEYAAYFLGKSKVYLQKKRTQDKQKITRDSLPFKIDGRDVQYPVEALLAFKAKDWDTLKNLRKKYPIPTD